MCLSEVLDILKTVASLATLVTVIIAYKNYEKDKNNPDLNRRRFYWDFFVPQYLDATFVFNGQEIALKDARHNITLSYPKWNDGGGYDSFVEKSLISCEPTVENKLAHRLSVILNRVGQAAFIGDLPLDYIFPISAKMILADWEKSKALIYQGIAKDGSDYVALHFTRKFAHWISCVSCMYLVNFYTDNNDNQSIANARKDCKGLMNQLLFKGHANHDAIISDLNADKYTSAADKLVSIIDCLEDMDKSIFGKIPKKYVSTLKKTFNNKMKSLM